MEHFAGALVVAVLTTGVARILKVRNPILWGLLALALLLVAVPLVTLFAYGVDASLIDDPFNQMALNSAIYIVCSVVMLVVVLANRGKSRSQARRSRPGAPSRPPPEGEGLGAGAAARSTSSDPAPAAATQGAFAPADPAPADSAPESRSGPPSAPPPESGAEAAGAQSETAPAQPDRPAAPSDEAPLVQAPPAVDAPPPTATAAANAENSSWAAKVKDAETALASMTLKDVQDFSDSDVALLQDVERVVSGVLRMRATAKPET